MQAARPAHRHTQRYRDGHGRHVDHRRAAQVRQQAGVRAPPDRRGRTAQGHLRQV